MSEYRGLKRTQEGREGCCHARSLVWRERRKRERRVGEITWYVQVRDARRTAIQERREGKGRVGVKKGLNVFLCSACRPVTPFLTHPHLSWRLTWPATLYSGYSFSLNARACHQTTQPPGSVKYRAQARTPKMASPMTRASAHDSPGSRLDRRHTSKSGKM
jgi:hypothetical protein